MKEPKRRPWVKRTYKKGYTGSKRVDKSCRNHGSCSYCKKGRIHKNKRQVPDTNE